MKRKRLYLFICLILKYLFAMLFPVLAVTMHRMSWQYIVVALAEVCLIALVTNLLCRVKVWLGYGFNVLALLFMNIQFAVLYWGSTFVSAVMLANLDSASALSGKSFVYGLTVVMVLLFSFLPVCLLPGKKKTTAALGGVTVILYAGVILAGMMAYSPYRAVYTLYQQMERSRMRDNAVKEAMSGTAGGSESENNTEYTEDGTGQTQEENEFYSELVADYIKKPEGISENPNVILIFVEGMSQNIIEDPRNIMPNISAFQDDSISFINYYNHTFATYMGLSGQLHSDYQRDNYDENPLISIQDIFKSYGYRTTFINTEPDNEDFSKYLANFEFDELIADKSREDGMIDSLSDKAAYELLFETALEQNKGEAPFFLAMYSYGTHAFLDGVHEKFADQSSALLNKFYDCDVQVGKFLEQFRESELAENTVIVLTTDHATYQEADFATAFPDYLRGTPSLDRIPLMIYYTGVTPEQYDVNGRNSLDLTPTILDFLDMSAPNYFLGDSLFAPESGSLYDTCFESQGNYYCTAGGEINYFSSEQMRQFEKQLTQYYVMKFSESQTGEGFKGKAYVYAEESDDRAGIVTELYNAEAWDTVSYAVWSQEGNQDDIQWFLAPGNHESCLTYEIDLSGYDREGVYFIHVYGSMEEDDEPTFLAETRIYIE